MTLWIFITEFSYPPTDQLIGNKVPFSISDICFEGLILTLIKKVSNVYLVATLKDPNDDRTLAGLVDCEDDAGRRAIFISAATSANANRSEQGVTLVHELLHIVYDDEEVYVEDFSQAIWHQITPSQQRILINYIPNELSDKRPTPMLKAEDVEEMPEEPPKNVPQS